MDELGNDYPTDVMPNKRTLETKTPRLMMIEERLKNPDVFRETALIKAAIARKKPVEAVKRQRDNLILRQSFYQTKLLKRQERYETTKMPPKEWRQ